MAGGYLKLFRKLRRSAVWNTGEPFTRGQAWVDLLMAANYTDRTIFIRGVPVPLKRGQVGESAVTLAEKWNRSRGWVLRFLSWLETVQQIEQQKNNVTTVITILNFNDHQGGDTADGTASDTADGQQTDTTKNQKKESDQFDQTDVTDEKLCATCRDLLDAAGLDRPEPFDWQVAFLAAGCHLGTPSVALDCYRGVKVKQPRDPHRYVRTSLRNAHGHSHRNDKNGEFEQLLRRVPGRRWPEMNNATSASVAAGLELRGPN